MFVNWPRAICSMIRFRHVPDYQARRRAAFRELALDKFLDLIEEVLGECLYARRVLCETDERVEDLYVVAASRGQLGAFNRIWDMIEREIELDRQVYGYGAPSPRQRRQWAAQKAARDEQ